VKRTVYLLHRLIKDTRGQDMLEYVLLAGAVAAIAMAIFPAVAATNNLYSKATSALAVALAMTGTVN